MLATTGRYADEKTRVFAKSFANATASVYCARGKKTVEKLASLARRKGENTLALVSEAEISFISVSAHGWKWKDEILKIKKYEIGEAVEEEIGGIEGPDSGLLEKLFGIDSFYGGEITISAGKGKMKFASGENVLLEMKYEIAEGKNAE